jgi:protein-S-isoprenylcysteine O-methyltransferase Ste14
VSAWAHVRAILLLPVVVTIVVPATIVVLGDGPRLAWGLGGALRSAILVIGACLLALGAALVVWTIRLFVRIGRGTLAPWDPTTELVVHGPYRHVRNPMLSGVFCLLAAEATVLGSQGLVVWFAAVVAVNAVYIPLVEEPGLRRRFGEPYDRYRANVPRWVPRPRAWSP